MIERLKEFVEKENKKRGSEKGKETKEEKESEKESEKSESVGVIESLGEKEIQIKKIREGKRGRSESLYRTE